MGTKQGGNRGSCTVRVLVSLLPAGCLRARKAVPLVRSWCKCSRSSQGICTRPGPTWRCASSCRWFSASRSAPGHLDDYHKHRQCGVPVWAACAYRQPFANISRVEPAVRVQRLGSPLWILKVALKHVRSLHTHLDGRREGGWGQGKQQGGWGGHLEWLTSPSPLEAK